MISEELLEEIIELSKNNKLIDKSLITRIIIDIICKSDEITQNSFNKIVFSKINWKNVLCTCNLNSGIIKVDYDKCVSGLIKKNKHDNNFILKYNLEFIRYILHEIEHLKESYKMTKYNVESVLIYLSSLSLLLSNKGSINKNIYLKLYDIIPAERIADVESYKLLLNSIYNFHDFEKQYEEVVNYIYRNYVFEYYKGYKKFSHDTSPFIIYLTEISNRGILSIDDLKPLEELCNKENLTIEEKMKYGLPVDLLESKQLNKSLRNVINR